MSNDLIRISVLYDSKEIILDLNPLDDDIYDKLIKSLEESSGIKNIEKNFKLTTLNSNIPYLLIDENNLWTILNEDRKEENLKILMNKIEFNEKEEDEEDIFSSGLQRVTKGNYEDFGEIEYFPDDKNEEDNKDNNESNNINNIENDDENKNNDIQVDIKENNIDNTNNDNNDLDIINIEDKLNMINLGNIENNSQNNNIKEKNKEEKKDESGDDFNDLELLTPNQDYDRKEKEKEEEDYDGKDDIIKIDDFKNIIKEFKKENEEEIHKIKKIKKNKFSKNKENVFKNEICSICEQNLSSIKYICALCEKIILCEECEKVHNHPCFIYKSNFISSLNDTYKFITKNYENIFVTKSKFFSLTIKNYDLSLSLIGDNNICFRPNKKVLIPIKVINNTNKIINSSKFMMIIKGNKLINLSYNESQIFKILPKSFYIIKLVCETPSKLCTENISLELYSAKKSFKIINNKKINICIEINEDQNEEKLNNNDLINNNENIICYNKEHKEILLSLLENHLNGQNPIEVINELIKYNWDKEKMLENSIINKKQ